MKKFLLLLAVAFATTAIAGNLVPSKKEFNLGKKKYSLVYKNSVVKPSKVAGLDLSGDYVGAAVTDDPVNSSGPLTITSTGDNAYTVMGAHLALPSASVTATFADGKLTIPSGQTIYTHPTYGPAGLFGITAANELVDIEFTLDENRHLVADPTLTVAVVLLSGTYAGYTLGDEYTNYSFIPVNASISSDAVNSDMTPADPDKEVYAGAVKITQDASGNVTGGVVYGFDEMTWLPFTVEGDNVQFSNDKVYYYSSSYGLAFATDLTEEGRFNASTGPTGTIDIGSEEGIIRMPLWSFMLPTTGSSPKYYILNQIKKNTVITFDASVVTSINSVKDIVAPVKTVKSLRNGQLVIERNGQLFNAAGALLK